MIPRRLIPEDVPAPTRRSGPALCNLPCTAQCYYTSCPCCASGPSHHGKGVLLTNTSRGPHPSPCLLVFFNCPPGVVTRVGADKYQGPSWTGRLGAEEWHLGPDLCLVVAGGR